MTGRCIILIADVWVTLVSPPRSQPHLPWSPASPCLIFDIFGALGIFGMFEVPTSILNCDLQGATLPEVKAPKLVRSHQGELGVPCDPAVSQGSYALTSDRAPWPGSTCRTASRSRRARPAAAAEGSRPRRSAGPDRCCGRRGSRSSPPAAGPPTAAPTEPGFPG